MYLQKLPTSWTRIGYCSIWGNQGMSKKNLKVFFFQPAANNAMPQSYSIFSNEWTSLPKTAHSLPSQKKKKVGYTLITQHLNLDSFKTLHNYNQTWNLQCQSSHNTSNEKSIYPKILFPANVKSGCTEKRLNTSRNLCFLWVIYYQGAAAPRLPKPDAAPMLLQQVSLPVMFSLSLNPCKILES